MDAHRRELRSVFMLSRIQAKTDRSPEEQPFGGEATAANASQGATAAGHWP